MTVTVTDTVRNFTQSELNDRSLSWRRAGYHLRCFMTCNYISRERRGVVIIILLDRTLPKHKEMGLGGEAREELYIYTIKLDKQHVARQVISSRESSIREGWYYH